MRRALSEDPLVSVIMPCYNSAHLVANAIMSIKNQTYKNWELIIIDDESDDGEVLPGIVAFFNDKRIKLKKIKHGGVVKAQMAGHKIAKGELHTVQAADDLSLPDRLDRAVVAFRKDKELDVYVHSLYTNLWTPACQAIFRSYRKAKRVKRKDLLQEQSINGVPVFRKEVIKTCPLREATRDAYDWAFHLDWMFNGFKYKFDSVATYEYVRHQNSLSERNERSGRRRAAIKKIQKIVLREYGAELKPKEWNL